tara:strand:- start:20 stop:682 length:663 start_codon:yes stop_codon:yes gene_type:complete
MNILSIDSSGNVLSIELKKNDEFYSYLDPQKSRASQIILSSIDKIMSDNKLDVSDLNLIIFNKGPASFTGTRIAASVCQAIGYTLNIPVIGVNSLSLMAYKYNYEKHYSKVTCIKKAYGDKYYLGQFDIEKTKYNPTQALSLCSADELRFNSSDHYVSDCWDQIKSNFEEKVFTNIKTIDQPCEPSARLLIEYVSTVVDYNNEFDLKMTFPDYANHTIDL